MATANDKVVCVKCQKTKNTVRCGGCAKDFCLTHMNEHHQELSEELAQTEDQYNQFKNTIEERKRDFHRHALIKQIDDWEKESVAKIRQVADRVRGQVSSHIDDSTAKVNSQLQLLTEQLSQCRKEDDFGDKDVYFFNEKLQRLKALTDALPECQLGYGSTPFISKIHVVNEGTLPRSAHIKPNATWAQIAVTITGGNGRGDGMNQHAHPTSIIADDDNTLYIVDTWNHRIMAWKEGETEGRVVAGGNGQGHLADQLNTPTDVLIDRETDSLIIADRGNRRVVRWPRHNGTTGETIISDVGCYGLAMDQCESLYVVHHGQLEVRRYEMGREQGTIVAGGNGSGDRLDQLQYAKYVFVDRDQAVYVSDWNNHRVIKWKKNATKGIVVAGGQGVGNGLTQLSCPNGIVVDESGCVYVADSGNDRIIRWSKDAREGSVVLAGNRKGDQTHQLCEPTGLSFDGDGNLYVVDKGNSRIQKFSINRS